MKKIIIANWKMNPPSSAQADDLLTAIREYYEKTGNRDRFSLVLCPPFVYIGHTASKSRLIGGDIIQGAQDIATDDKGAFTGEISGLMLKDLGAGYAIIGHSERRWKLGESDETVNAKLTASLRNGIVPIVCLGEKARDENFKDFLTRQTASAFNDVAPGDISKCLIAYEPVWAISSNPGAKPDNPESALESIRIIRSFLSSELAVTEMPVFLYGGSVTSKNAASFMSRPEIGGVLVGSASVNAEEFVRILDITNNL